jgi:hypothetical protein
VESGIIFQVGMLMRFCGSIGGLEVATKAWQSISWYAILSKPEWSKVDYTLKALHTY